MRVAMLAPEAAPFARTGGLGDALGALPHALAALGHEVSLFLPLYRGLRERFASVPGLGSIAVRMLDGFEEATVLRAAGGSGAAVYAIAADRYFDRPFLYGEAGGDYADNARRFTFFCRAALAAIDRLGLEPDVVHCHDWQTALAPAYLRGGILSGDAAAASAAKLARAAVVFTVHDLGYQGVFPSSDFAITGLPRGLYSSDGLEFYGKVNLLKAGLFFADHVTTVSPRYAREIRTPERGCGLEGVLHERSAEVTGILNGIDAESWNPATDRHLAARYSAADPRGKRRCKADLLVELDLDADLEAPIAAMVAPLATHEGFDVVLDALPALLERGLRLVALGEGEATIASGLSAAARRAPGRVAFCRASDEALARKVLAGADMLLVPSLYEPSGQGAMTGLRYGAVPIASAAGGLLDTVIDAVAAPRQATGVLIREHTAESLTRAIDHALGLHRVPEAWRALVARGMEKDFSWARSARRYGQLFERVIRRRRGATLAAPRIKFGTSGWRAELADEFTMSAVSAVAQAIAEHVLEDPERPALAQQGLLVAHDTRFLGREFALRAAGVVAANDVPVVWCDQPLPAPAVSYAVTRRDFAGAINVTASHNHFTWNGMKFSPAWGGPALPETTDDVEVRANAWLARGRAPESVTPDEARAVGLWRREDLASLYRAGVAERIDVDAIRGAGVRVAVDLLWGTASGTLDRLLAEWGAMGAVLHPAADPYFGHGRPDPSEAELRDLAAAVRAGHALGVATDCDADRFGIVDADGSFVPPNHVIALLVDYLCETRPHLARKVGRSVATTHLIDAVAAARGVAVVETPVGFGFLGALLARGEIMLGGEESGGLSIQGHIPDKDGILVALLVTEMVARRRTSLRAMLERLVAEVGLRVPLRRDIELSAAAVARLPEHLARRPDAIGAFGVERVVTVDGAKHVLEGDRWVLLRASGTEPVLRLYVEGRNRAEAEHLLDAAAELFLPRGA